MAYIRQSIRDNAVTAITGLSTTGSNVFRSRVYPLGTNKLPALCVYTDSEVVKGFGAQKLGHTITAIFDPSADTETGFLNCFAEPQEAAEFLTYKRGR